MISDCSLPMGSRIFEFNYPLAYLVIIRVTYGDWRDHQLTARACRGLRRRLELRKASCHWHCSNDCTVARQADEPPAACCWARALCNLKSGPRAS